MGSRDCIGENDLDTANMESLWTGFDLQGGSGWRQSRLREVF